MWGELICLPSPRESVLAIAPAHATAPLRSARTPDEPLLKTRCHLLPPQQLSFSLIFSFVTLADGTVWWMHGAVAGGELRLPASGAPRPPAPLLALHPGRCQCVLPPPPSSTTSAHSGSLGARRGDEVERVIRELVGVIARLAVGNARQRSTRDLPCPVSACPPLATSPFAAVASMNSPHRCCPQASARRTSGRPFIASGSTTTWPCRRPFPSPG